MEEKESLSESAFWKQLKAHWEGQATANFANQALSFDIRHTKLYQKQGDSEKWLPILSQLSFRGSEIQNSYLADIRFEHSDFTQTELIDSIGENLTFQSCIFPDTQILNSKFHQCLFQDCVFLNSDVKQSIFHDCTFVNCHIEDRSAFQDATVLSHTSFQDCVLQNAYFNYATLSPGVHFAACDLGNIHMLESDCSHIFFDAKTSLHHSTIYKTDFSSADFSFLAMQDNDFMDCNLETARLGNHFPEILQVSVNLPVKDTFARIPIALNLRDGRITCKDFQEVFPTRSIPLRNFTQMLQKDKIPFPHPKTISQFPAALHKYFSLREGKKCFLTSLQNMQKMLDIYQALFLNKQK